jgi:hypothetical protein
MKKMMIPAIAGLLFVSAQSMGQRVVVVHRAPCRVIAPARVVVAAPIAVVRPAPVVVLAPRRVVYPRRVVVLR